MCWSEKGALPPLKARRIRSVKRTMFAVFFNIDGIVAAIPLEERKTVTAEWYTSKWLPVVLCSLDLRLLLVPEQALPAPNNAPAHTAGVTKAFAAEKGVKLLNPPPTHQTLLLALPEAEGASALLWLKYYNSKSAYQKEVPEDFPYPCPNRNLWRSEIPPSSVHRLRPGDIDVVAAIGDSLTAGNGALTDTVFEVYFNENRGVSWSIGGQGTWRQFLTVPNLLKVMNPNLVGYSIDDGSVYSREAQLNVAYSGAMDQDLVNEAVRLIARMKRNPKIDFQNHWKMVTVMIGTNDICSDQCYDQNEGVETHKNNLIKLLDYLYENMPKTFVNLVVMPYIPYYAELIKPPFAQCFAMQLITCSCLFGGFSAVKKLPKIKEMTRKFQKVQEEIAESGRYDRKEDFVVVFQPTNLNSRFPKLPLSRLFPKKIDTHDYSYVAIDCIHYTQKLHARIANIYWNNLFEDPGNKTGNWEAPAYSKFLCPTERKPYLLTKKNYFIDFLDLKDN